VGGGGPSHSGLDLTERHLPSHRTALQLTVCVCMYIYIYICVCVCVYIYIKESMIRFCENKIIRNKCNKNIHKDKIRTSKQNAALQECSRIELLVNVHMPHCSKDVNLMLMKVVQVGHRLMLVAAYIVLFNSRFILAYKAHISQSFSEQ
jgi:hypothetical protein